MLPARGGGTHEADCVRGIRRAAFPVFTSPPRSASSARKLNSPVIRKLPCRSAIPGLRRGPVTPWITVRRSSPPRCVTPAPSRRAAAGRRGIEKLRPAGARPRGKPRHVSLRGAAHRSTGDSARSRGRAGTRGIRRTRGAVRCGLHPFARPGARHSVPGGSRIRVSAPAGSASARTCTRRAT